MTWNWQQPDWPNFRWEAARLTYAEQQFLVGAGTLIGTVRHLGSESRDQITVETISTEAVTTSEIEGEVLDRASVQSSIRQQLGFAADNRRVRPAEQGIAELMVDLYRSFADDLSDQTLFAWHRMLVRGRHDLRDIGCYRTGTEPMQVVSGPIHKPKIHFEAPPAARTSAEMTRIITWFNRTGPAGSKPLPALTRAGWRISISSLSIHSKTGTAELVARSLKKILAQSMGQPTLVALAATILAKRRSYYEALEWANKHNEITDWLTWFACHGNRSAAAHLYSRRIPDRQNKTA